MKKVVLILCVLFCFGSARAQYNYCNFNPVNVQDTQASTYRNTGGYHLLKIISEDTETYFQTIVKQ